VTATRIVYPLWGVLRLREEQGEPIAPSVFRLALPKDPDQRYARVADATAEADYRRAMAPAEQPLRLAPVPLDALAGRALARQTVSQDSCVTP
jgi:hypothetical protein